MTAEPPQPDPAPDRHRRIDRAAPALAAYTARMRRARAWYFGAIVVALAAIVVAVSIAWTRGEIAHTTLRTAATPAPSIALQTPARTVRQAWTSTDRTAIGTPYRGGTVITYDAHTVRGRDGSSGAVSWSYTRDNRIVCTAAQVGGVTIAVYQLAGNCNQVTALDSRTGDREWTRTLDENGQPVLGQPRYQVTQSAFLVISPSVIYDFRPSDGVDTWIFGQPRCTIHGAVLGSAGALISQTCTHPNCAGLTYCHDGPQLLLRDGSAGRSDDAKDKANPDRIIWNLAGNTDLPASADTLVSAIDPDSHQLAVLDAAKGTTLAELALDRVPVELAAVRAIPTTDRELIWAGGVSYAVDPADHGVTWRARTTGPPTVTSTTAAGSAVLPELSNALLAAPTTRGVALLDPGTGRPSREFAVPPPPAGSSVYPLGAGLLVGGAATAVYR